MLIEERMIMSRSWVDLRAVVGMATTQEVTSEDGFFTRPDGGKVDYMRDF